MGNQVANCPERYAFHKNNEQIPYKTATKSIVAYPATFGELDELVDE